MTPEVVLFYFDGCPSWKPALKNLEVELESLGYTHKIILVNVANETQVDSLRFLGSPTIRVNGLDLEYGAEEPTDGYFYGCRIYQENTVRTGIPARSWLRTKLLATGLFAAR